MQKTKRYAENKNMIKLFKILSEIKYKDIALYVDFEILFIV